LLVQLLNVSDLRAETRNLFPENFHVIHAIKNTSSRAGMGRWRNQSKPRQYARQ
jgi:hypothetical protein